MAAEAIRVYNPTGGGGFEIPAMGRSVDRFSTELTGRACCVAAMVSGAACYKIPRLIHERERKSLRKNLEDLQQAIEQVAKADVVNVVTRQEDIYQMLAYCVAYRMLAYCYLNPEVKYTFTMPREGGGIATYTLTKIFDMKGEVKAFGFTSADVADPPILLYHGTIARPRAHGFIATMRANLERRGVGWSLFHKNKEQIETWMAEQGGHVIVLGHSLGGALGAQTGVYCSAWVSEVHTFATAGVGEEVLRDWGRLPQQTRKAIKIINHVNSRDPVSRRAGYLIGEAYCYEGSDTKDIKRRHCTPPCTKIDVRREEVDAEGYSADYRAQAIRILELVSLIGVLVLMAIVVPCILVAWPFVVALVSVLIASVLTVLVLELIGRVMFLPNFGT